MIYGPDVRAQVLEVVIRQALAGAPWREICAGPMAVNNITPEEVEYQVERRLNAGKELLTPEQNEQLNNYIAYWESIATAPGSRSPTVDLAVTELYKRGGWGQPRIVFCESPAMLWFFLHCLDDYNLQSSNSLALAEQLIPVLRRRCNWSYQSDPYLRLKALSEETRIGIGPCISPIIQSRMERLDHEISARMNKTLDKQLVGFFRTGLLNQLNRSLRRVRTTFNVTRNTINEDASGSPALLSANRFLGEQGFIDLGDGLFPGCIAIWSMELLISNGFAHECFNDALQLDPDTVQTLQSFLSLFKMAPWYVFFDNVCFVGIAPGQVAFDQQFRLNSRTGPAITFLDGYQIYARDGIVVPGKLIEKPDELSIADIEVEENAAVRRMMVDTYGAARYLQDSGAKLVNEDECGQLYRKAMLHDEDIVMVRVRNSTPEPDGSYKYYFLRVPPEMQTARDAVAWTFNIGPNEYHPNFES